jgi:hypothetical protein
MGHGSGPAFLQRQSGLGAIERLYLAHMGRTGSRDALGCRDATEHSGSHSVAFTPEVRKL